MTPSPRRRFLTTGTESTLGRFVASAGLALLLLLTPSCVAHHRGSEGERTQERVVLHLQDYQANLRLILVTIAGTERPFIFDTGGGVSLLSPETAREVGCQPYSRMTGYRMHGERVDFARCQPISVQVGGAPVHIADVGLFDVGSLLPPEWPKVAGVIGLNAFDGRTVTLDLGVNELVLESEQSAAERTRTLQAGPLRVRRELEAGAVDLFLPIETPRGPIWMLLDSGNVSGAVLDHHAAEALGLDAPERKPRELTLHVVGGETFTEPVGLADLIVEGNLGEHWMRQRALTVDLRTARIWVAPSRAARRAPPPTAPTAPR